MSTGLDAVLQRLDVGDAAFGAECRPPIARGQIWAYRHGRKVPRSDTAAAILEALKQRGVKAELRDILAAKPPNGKSRKR